MSTDKSKFVRGFSYAHDCPSCGSREIYFSNFPSKRFICAYCSNIYRIFPENKRVTNVNVVKIKSNFFLWKKTWKILGTSFNENKPLFKELKTDEKKQNIINKGCIKKLDKGTYFLAYTVEYSLIHLDCGSLSWKRKSFFKKLHKEYHVTHISGN